MRRKNKNNKNNSKKSSSQKIKTIFVKHTLLHTHLHTRTHIYVSRKWVQKKEWRKPVTEMELTTRTETRTRASDPTPAIVKL